MRPQQSLQRGEKARATNRLVNIHTEVEPFRGIEALSLMSFDQAPQDKEKWLSIYHFDFTAEYAGLLPTVLVSAL
jgi:hypothetical protein